jgi:hypothetical protein
MFQGFSKLGNLDSVRTFGADAIEAGVELSRTQYQLFSRIFGP